MTGVIAIFGIAWMTDTFFLAHKAFVIDSLGGIVREYPILFAVMIFVMSALLLSQGATTRSIMPIGVSLGLPLGSRRKRTVLLPGNGQCYFRHHF